MFKILIALFIGFLLISATAFAAPTDLAVTSGTCALTVAKKDAYGATPSVICLAFAWTSDTSGNVTVTTVNSFHGLIMRIVTIPGATAPTDNYDITLFEHGVDALVATGQNRDTANTEQVVYPTSTVPPTAIAGPLNLNIANAGSAKVGAFYVFIKQF